MDFITLAAYSDYSSGSSGASAGTLIGMLIGCVIGIVIWWKIFTKAGEAGWKSIIPIYNIYTMVKLFWDTNAVLMTILMFVPIVNMVIALILMYKMCKAFDKGVGFFILMLLFAPIALLILAFGSADYVGPQ